jgi:hypothetical protein
MSPSTVDLSTGPRTITITADATDASGNGAGSGVKRVDVFISGPRAGASARLSLTSGTAVDGVWTGAVTIPKDARAGIWSVRDVSAEDAVGNYQDYSGGGKHAESPTDLRLQSGWDTSITVTGTGTTPPKQVKAGKISGFDFTPQAVDTTHSARRVHISASFTAPRPKRVNLDFVKRSGTGRRLDTRIVFKRTTGGHWAGHFTVHRWMGDSTVEPQLFVQYGRNVRPQFKILSSDTLQAKHFPTKLKITSKADKTKPKLKTLSFSPSSVDTTAGSEKVTVTATATDTRSGVGRVNADLFINDGGGGSPVGLYPYPGLGYGQSSSVEVSLKRSGDQWVGTAKFRECVPSGNWHVDVFVSDRAGNNAAYSPKKLTAAGLPGSLSVTATPGDVEDPNVRDATAAGADHTITLDFTEGVKNVNTSTLSVFAVKPAASRFENPTSVTGMTCSNGTTNVACSGSGGLVTSAVLKVPALSGGTEFEVYANLNAITSQLTDGAGNPLPWGYEAADVTGS